MIRPWKALFCAMCFFVPQVWAQTPGTIPVPDDPNVRVLAHLADAPEGHVDYAQVQTAIEQAINPTFNAKAFNAELEHWTIIVRARVPKDATPTQVMTALGEVIYSP